MISIANQPVLQAGGVSAGDAVMLIGIGLGAVVATLLGIYLLAKREVFAPGEENQETARERVEADELLRSEFSIPLRAKVRSLSGPAKTTIAASASLLILLVYLSVKLMQSGGPASQYLTLEVAVATVGIGGILGGMRLHSWVEGRIGKMYNVYENAEGEPDVEKVEFYRHEVLEEGERTLIQQLHPTRLLGVFRRRYLVGQHRRLRGSPKPLTDVITHQVPQGKHAVELEPGLIMNLTAGEPVYNESPEAVADVSYRSPNNLSYERAVHLEQSKRRMRIERDAWQTTSAAKDAELERLADVVINREWQSKEDLMGLLREYEEMQRERTRAEPTRRRDGQGFEWQGESVLSNGEPEGEEVEQ